MQNSDNNSNNSSNKRPRAPDLGASQEPEVKKQAVSRSPSPLRLEGTPQQEYNDEDSQGHAIACSQPRSHCGSPVTIPYDPSEPSDGDHEEDDEDVPLPLTAEARQRERLQRMALQMGLRPRQTGGSLTPDKNFWTDDERVAFYKKSGFTAEEAKHEVTAQPALHVPRRSVTSELENDQVEARRKVEMVVNSAVLQLRMNRGEFNHLAPEVVFAKDTPKFTAPRHQKRGLLAFWTEQGCLMTYEAHSIIGMLAHNLAYFYVLTVPLQDLDPTGKAGGKLKIGMSWSSGDNEYPKMILGRNNAHRLGDYRRMFGDNVKLHCLILFQKGAAALDFETAMKIELKYELPENGSNLSNGFRATDVVKVHEWYGASDLARVMQAVRVKREALGARKWNARGGVQNTRRKPNAKEDLQMNLVQLEELESAKDEGNLIASSAIAARKCENDPACMARVKKEQRKLALHADVKENAPKKKLRLRLDSEGYKQKSKAGAVVSKTSSKSSDKDPVVGVRRSSRISSRKKKR